MLVQKTEKHNWAVIMKADRCTTSFITQHMAYVPQALREGFALVQADLSAKEASQLRHDLMNGSVQLHEVA